MTIPPRLDAAERVTSRHPGDESAPVRRNATRSSEGRAGEGGGDRRTTADGGVRTAAWAIGLGVLLVASVVLAVTIGPA
ncbi:MAG TPA: hypothetical protein VFE99_02535, partial [Agromyces sp.]|nr:hypothetical protein [Agromyces sp.]